MNILFTNTCRIAFITLGLLSVAYLVGNVAYTNTPEERENINGDELTRTDEIYRPKIINGIAYSPFRDCQTPDLGKEPSLEEIVEDLYLLRDMGNAIRTYSSRGLQGEIPRLAIQQGMRVSAGAWLDKDMQTNEQEIEALIRVAQNNELHSVIVGNEVLFRRDLDEDQLIAYIEKVRAAVDVPVTTAAIGATLEKHPKVMAAVDYFLIHHYAFWEGQSIDAAARLTISVALEFQRKHGKRVVIGETGWPSGGPTLNQAIPSPENQYRFFNEFIYGAQQNGIEFYYFSAFDELWKGKEDGVGPHWGLLYADRTNKYDRQSVLQRLPPPAEGSNDTVVAEPVKGAGYYQGSTPDEDPMEEKFAVFANFGSQHKFTPSGWMGDVENISFTDCWRPSVRESNSVIRIKYTPAQGMNHQGWAGIYWLSEDNNWGNEHGLDLREFNFNRVSFRARSDNHDTRARFFVGGVAAGKVRSSIPVPIHSVQADEEGYVTLSTNWQQFEINLEGVDQSNIIGGFGWTNAADDAPDAIVFYLDDILFESN